MNVKEYHYLAGKLENETENLIAQLIFEYQKRMKSLYSLIDLKSLEDPKNWENIEMNGFMIKEISLVQKIFAQVED